MFSSLAGHQTAPIGKPLSGLTQAPAVQWIPRVQQTTPKEAWDRSIDGGLQAVPLPCVLVLSALRPWSFRGAGRTSWQRAVFGAQVSFRVSDWQRLSSIAEWWAWRREVRNSLGCPLFPGDAFPYLMLPAGAWQPGSTSALLFLFFLPPQKTN
jgi:hypothetical protein